MSDLRKDSAVRAGSDALYQQLVLNAVHACTGWAETMFEGTLDLLLWPHDRDLTQSHPVRVDTRVVERGVWRVTLCPKDALPAGVDQATRDAVLRAEVTLDGMSVPFPVIDQVVQCGLFGEVLYRWAR